MYSSLSRSKLTRLQKNIPRMTCNTSTSTVVERLNSRVNRGTVALNAEDMILIELTN
jgi:hypothetical protein